MLFLSRGGTKNDCKSLEQIVNIAQDISEMKTLIQNVRRSILTSTETYARTLTVNTSSRLSQASKNTVNGPGNILKQTNHNQRQSTNATTASTIHILSKQRNINITCIDCYSSDSCKRTPRASDSTGSFSQQYDHATTLQDSTATDGGEWQTARRRHGRRGRTYSR